MYCFIQDQKEKFISILLTLKLVGKFLGFVTFLPYKNTSKLPDDTEAAYMALRKHVSCLSKTFE